MTERDRQRAIERKLSRIEIRAAGAIPTGSAALDRALGVAGFPRGRIVEIFGPASCGKTTLALRATAHAQSRGFTVAWIDADCAFDAGYASSLGAAVERMAVMRPSSAEAALEMAEKLAASGGVDLLVIDSAAALTPRLELAAGLGESGPGLQARVLGSGLRRLARVLVRTDCVALFVNQMRGRGGGGALEPETTAGGPSLKLYAAIRLALRRLPGGVVAFRVMKNKVAAPFGEGRLVPSGSDEPVETQ